MRRISDSTNLREAGFSLFEIAVAMAILSLISGTVMSVLWQAGDTAAEIRFLDRRDEEVNRFVALLRETIEGLPPEAAMSMTPAADTDSGYDELKLENASTAFVFGETVGSAEEVYIALRPGAVLETGEQTYDLAISRTDFVPDDGDGSGMVFNAGGDDMLQADEDGRYWLPLLSGVSGASWRFWDEEQQEWLDEWTDEDAMTPLMEFSLLDGGASLPSTIVFRVPDRLVNPEEAGAAQTSTQNSSTTAVQSTNRAPGSTDRSGNTDGARPGGQGRPDGGGRGDGRPGGGRPGGGRPGGGGGPRGPGGGGGPGGPGGGGGPPAGGGGGASGGGTR